MSGASVPTPAPPKLSNIVHEDTLLSYGMRLWDERKLDDVRPSSDCFFFFLECASFFHVCFLEACINK